MTLNTLAALLLASMAAAADAEWASLRSCVRTIDAGILSAWHPKDGSMICKKGAMTCYMGYSDGTNYHFELPKSPAYAVLRVEGELMSAPQTYDNYLVTFADPKSGEAVYLNLFTSDETSLFGRKVTEPYQKAFQSVTVVKSKDKSFQKVADSHIMGSFELIKGNMANRSFPPGWDAARYAENAKKRLSGCLEFDSEAKDIVAQADALASAR